MVSKPSRIIKILNKKKKNYSLSINCIDYLLCLFSRILGLYLGLCSLLLGLCNRILDYHFKSVARGLKKKKIIIQYNNNEKTNNGCKLLVLNVLWGLIRWIILFIASLHCFAAVRQPNHYFIGLEGPVLPWFFLIFLQFNLLLYN